MRDLGGGFLFAGGEAGYGPGRLGSQHHGAPLARAQWTPSAAKKCPASAMALVIDRSGSMTGLPMEMAKAACRATVETLQGDDLIEGHRLRFDAGALREDAASALPRTYPK